MIVLRVHDSSRDCSTAWLCVRAQSATLCWNGVAVARVRAWAHDPKKVWAIAQRLGLENDEIERAYGPLFSALRFGCPPHATASIGLDRLAALLLGRGSVEEVIAFPKSRGGRDPLSGAPARIEPRLLQDLVEPF